MRKINFRVGYANIFVKIRTFHRPASAEASTRQVQIINTSCPPLESILHGFHSTIVTNFITWDKAYALFPASTFLHRHGVALRESDWFKPHAEKYKNRGYGISELRRRQDPRRSPSEIAEIRRPGDRLTWKLAFDITDIERPKKPAYVLEHSAFGFEHHVDPQDGELPYFINAQPFGACVLQHQYSRPNCNDFFRDIQTRLDRLTFEALQQLPTSMRPPSYRAMVRDPWNLQHYRDELLDDGICRLKCFDDQIPAWYAEWERQSPSSIRISMAPDDRYEAVNGIDNPSLQHE